MSFNYLNLVTHVLVGTVCIAVMVYGFRRNLIKEWPPERARLHVILIGVAYVSLAALWLVFALGPLPLLYLLAAATPSAVAALVIRVLNRHYAINDPAGSMAR